MEVTSRDRIPHDHLPKESRRDTIGSEGARKSASDSTLTNTDRGSAKKSASTEANAKRDADPRSGTLTEREPQENVSFDSISF